MPDARTYSAPHSPPRPRQAEAATLPSALEVPEHPPVSSAQTHPRPLSSPGLPPEPFLPHVTHHGAALLLPYQRSPVPSTASTGCSAADEKATDTASPPPWVPSCVSLGTAGKDPRRCPQRVPSAGPHPQLLWEPPAPFLKDSLLCEVSQPRL